MYFQSIQIQCKYCPPTLDSGEIAGVFGFQRQLYTGDTTSERPGRLRTLKTSDQSHERGHDT